MNRKILCYSLAWVIAGLAVGANRAWAQAPTPADKLFKEVQKHLDDQEYKEAIHTGEKFKTEFPADPRVWFAWFDICQAYRLDKQFAKAYAQFAELDKKAPKSLPDFREQIAFAVACTRGDQLREEGKRDPAKRAQLAKEMETAFEKFFKEYPAPKAINKYEAIFERGRARIEAETFGKAVEDLTAAIKGVNTPPIKGELLRRIQVTQANLFLRQAKIAKAANQNEKAEEFRKQAKGIFEDIAKRAQGNVVVLNEVFLNIANILYQDGEFDEAVEMFRFVRPKAEVVAFQTDAVNRALAMSRQNPGTATQQALEIEQQRQETIRKNPDPYVTAWLSIGRCYLEQQQFAEAFTIFRHLFRFADKPELVDKDQKKFAHYGVIAGYLGTIHPDEARDEFQKFQAEFGVDALADNVSYVVGEHYFFRQRFDEARAQAEKSIKEYPHGRFFVKACLLKATSYGANESAKKIEEMEKIKKLVEKSDDADEYFYEYGNALMGVYKYAEAIAPYRTLKEKFAESSHRVDAAFRVGICLLRSDKPDDAIAEFRKFIAENPDVKGLVADASFQMASAYDLKAQAAVGKLGKEVHYQAAIKELTDFIARDPKHDRAAEAQYNIAYDYAKMEKYKEMSAAFQMLIDQHPDSSFVPSAYMGVGLDFQRRQKNAVEAVKIFTVIVQKFKNNPKDQPLAAEAQYRMGETWLLAAKSLGVPAGMLPDKLKQWSELVGKAVVGFEGVLEQFPTSTFADQSLADIFSIQNSRVQSKQIESDAVNQYFTDMARKYAANPSLRIKILFIQAKLARSSGNPDRARSLYEEAFAATEKEKVPLGPATYEDYAKFLLAQTTPPLDRVMTLYQKIFEVAPDAESKARSLVGQGDLLVRQSKQTGAEKLYQQVLRDFDKTDAALGAKVGQAYILESKGKYDEAIKLYYDVAEKPGLIGAKARFRIGKCFLAKANDALKLNNTAEVDKNNAQALKYFKQFDVLFSMTEYAAEADFECGEILVRQATQKTGLEKQELLTQALKYFQIIADHYATSPMKEKALARVAELSPKK